jgi:hypothetical protein
VTSDSWPTTGQSSGRGRAGRGLSGGLMGCRVCGFC